MPIVSGEVRDCQVLTVDGVLTAELARELVRSSEKALAEAPRAVVIDLSAVPKMTATAASALFVLLDRLRAWPDCPVVLAAPNQVVVARLAATRLTERFVIKDSLLKAIVDPRGRPDVVVARVTLTSSLDAPRLARQFALAHVASGSSRHFRETVTLVVSELVSNAVTHVHGRFELRVTQYDGRTRISVKDHDGGAVQLPGPPRPGGGRGLMIVDALARSWGVLPTRDGGKIVWALLDNDD